MLHSLTVINQQYNCFICNFNFFGLVCLNNQVEEDEMGGAYGTNEGEEECV
jgi:hypothetical protein